MRVRTPGNLSEEQLDKILQFLKQRVSAQEHKEVTRLHYFYHVLNKLVSLSTRCLLVLFASCYLILWNEVNGNLTSGGWGDKYLGNLQVPLKSSMKQIINRFLEHFLIGKNRRHQNQLFTMLLSVNLVMHHCSLFKCFENITISRKLPLQLLSFLQVFYACTY